MIFDCDYVTDLVIRWQRLKDSKVLDLIIEQSMSLVEVIVSTYDPIYREDLIQESCMRVQYALPFFDPQISNLYNYLTTVIKNICITYLRQQYRYAEDYNIDVHVIEAPSSKEPDDILDILIERNRKRFPSYPVDIIDLVTEYVYEAFTFGNGKRKIIEDICKLSSSTRQEANALYISTLIYLRFHYKDHYNGKQTDYDKEYSIVPDLEEIFGTRLSETLCTILAGMQVKFP